MPNMPMRQLDIQGKTFNHLTALEIVGINKHRMAEWKCRCVCGREVVVLRGSLLSGNTKSCGCKTIEMLTKHGHWAQDKASPTYAAWCAMKHRCDNPANKHYQHYGGRGIKYDPRWAVFENFLQDMGEKPRWLTLERLNNNEGYSKMNCKWSPNSEQQQNKRNNHKVTLDGETLCLSEWARRKGMGKATLRARLKKGWPVELALTTPVEPRSPRVQADNPPAAASGKP